MYILITLMFALFLVMLVSVNERCNELEAEIKTVRETCQFESEELRKEIRLLKTDISILEDGTRK